MRKSPRGDARRRQILDGALAAIREQPIADVQLASIAAHAGLKPNHVLYYYSSRDEVLIAAVAHAEQTLAAGRSERLRTIRNPEARLRAFVNAYLPSDQHDPVWKLWVEGWLRSPSRAGFGEVGWEANLGWLSDLVEAVQHALPTMTLETDRLSGFGQRFLYLLDGLAIHVLAGHETTADAAEMAMSALRAELQVDLSEERAGRAD